MKHFNKDARCGNCCHKEYCYANSLWDERAQTCTAYNVKEKRDIVDKTKKFDRTN